MYEHVFESYYHYLGYCSSKMNQPTITTRIIALCCTSRVIFSSKISRCSLLNTITHKIYALRPVVIPCFIWYEMLMCNNVRLRFVCCSIRLNCLLALCWFSGHIILFGQMIDRLRAKRIMMHTVPSKPERRMCFILNENELDCYARYQIVLVTCVKGRF